MVGERNVTARVKMYVRFGSNGGTSICIKESGDICILMCIGSGDHLTPVGPFAGSSIYTIKNISDYEVLVF